MHTPKKNQICVQLCKTDQHYTMSAKHDVLFLVHSNKQHLWLLSFELPVLNQRTIKRVCVLHPLDGK